MFLSLSSCEKPRSLHNFCLTTTRLRFVKVVKSLAKIALEGEINNTGYYRPQMSHRWVENYTLKNDQITAKIITGLATNILSRERQTNCRLFQLIHIFLWNRNYASVKKTGKPTMLHKKKLIFWDIFWQSTIVDIITISCILCGLISIVPFVSSPSLFFFFIFWDWFIYTYTGQTNELLGPLFRQTQIN